MAISVSGTDINISGNETYANLVTTLAANPAAGSVSNRTVTLNYSINVQANATFTSISRIQWLCKGSAKIKTDSTATFDASNDNLIVFQDNPKSHSFFGGKLKGKRLSYFNDTSSGRSDFAKSSTIWDVDTLTLSIGSAGDTFLHFQDDQNALNLRGKTSIVNDKPSGAFYIEFDANSNGSKKTYSGFDLTEVNKSGVTLNVYAPRNNNGLVIMQDFQFDGTVTAEFRPGVFDTTSASTILRNPTFTGAAGNLGQFRKTIANNPIVSEEFSFSPATPLADGNFKIYATDQSSNVLLNTSIDNSNTEQYTLPSGVSNRVFWFKTRETNNTSNAGARKTFNIGMVSYGRSPITFQSLSLTSHYDYSAPLVSDPIITQSNKTTVDAYTEIETAQKLYDRAKSWLVDNYTGQTSTILSRNGDSIDLNALNIVVDKTAANAFAFNGTTITIKADSFSGNLLTTGSITASNGAVITGSIEDSLGVRVTFNLSDSSAFNLLVRREDTGAELGHETGITSFTYTLPRNITLRYALWREGSDTVYGTYDTSNGGAIITPSPLINDTIDTSVNVTSTLANISTTYSSGNFNIDFSAATSLSLENFKVVMHHLLGGEAAMQYLINNAGTQAFFIKTDELKVTQPKLILIRNASVSSSDVVEILAFINFEDAQTVQAQLNAAAVAAGGSATNYVPDPPTAAGLRVAYLKVKPAIDADQLARTTAALIDPSISQAIDHARAANIQTQ